MLARLQKSMKENDEGFTLIELLVVIVIIGILAAIAIPLFLSQREKGIDASVEADLKQMSLAQETYIVDNPSDPGFAYSGTLPTGIEFNASPDNTITVTLPTTGTAAGGYCIEGNNPGASDNAPFYYNSLSGGLTDTAC